MLMVEMKLNMIIEGNPYLINALDRSVNHDLIREYSYMINLKPFFSSFFKIKTKIKFYHECSFRNCFPFFDLMPSFFVSCFFK